MSSVYFNLYDNASKPQLNLIKHFWDVVQQEIVSMNVIYKCVGVCIHSHTYK